MPVSCEIHTKRWVLRLDWVTFRRVYIKVDFQGPPRPVSSVHLRVCVSINHVKTSFVTTIFLTRIAWFSLSISSPRISFQSQKIEKVLQSSRKFYARCTVQGVYSTVYNRRTARDLVVYFRWPFLWPRGTRWKVTATVVPVGRLLPWRPCIPRNDWKLSEFRLSFWS